MKARKILEAPKTGLFQLNQIKKNWTLDKSYLKEIRIMKKLDFKKSETDKKAMEKVEEKEANSIVTHIKLKECWKT